jgi:quinoprotein glucose dehydrogenase
MRRRFALSVVCVVALIVGVAGHGNQDKRTVWDAVYTREQAARGETIYTSTCARCHGPALEGDDAPALVGDTFMRNWGEDNLRGLFAKVDRMPPRMPPDRPTDANADLVAYILQANQFPAGADELSPSADALEKIQIVEKEGQRIPNFSLVRVVGCLTPGPANAWKLAQASEPVRTRNPAGSKDDELENSRAAPLGSQSFTLLSIYPSPDAHKGHRMEVKGFLIRNPNDDRINVSSIVMLGEGCTSPQ